MQTGQMNQSKRLLRAQWKRRTELELQGEEALGPIYSIPAIQWDFSSSSNSSISNSSNSIQISPHLGNLAMTPSVMEFFFLDCFSS